MRRWEDWENCAITERETPEKSGGDLEGQHQESTFRNFEL